MANEAQGVAAATSKDKPQGASVPVRWPWLALGVAGLLIPLLWLFLGSGDGATGGRRAAMAPAPGAPAARESGAGRPNIRLDSRPSAADQGTPAAPAPSPAPAAAPEPAAEVVSTEEAKTAPTERRAAPAPTTKDVSRKAGFTGGVPAGNTAVRETAKPAKVARPKAPPRPAPAKPASPVAAGPIGPDPGAGLAPAPPPPPPAAMAQAAPAPAPPPSAPRMAPGAVAAKPAAPRQRSLDVEAEEAAAERSAPAEPPKPRRAKGSGSGSDDLSDGVMGSQMGAIGSAGKSGRKQKVASDDAKPSTGKAVAKKRSGGGSRAGKGKGAAPPPPSPEAVPSEGAEGAEEADSDLASLQPGWFGAKIPEQMNLNESSRVRVTVTREENKAKGKAKLDAMAPTQAPAKVVEQDILVGKFLRVELRAFASEFEILAITSPEQRLIPGRVTTWEWAVVPRQPGPHELSVVVTNLTDARGNPIDLTVHSVSVEVQVKTMQKLKDVASLLSSAMGGLMSLLGMYKGILAPLLNRRREKEGEGGKDKSKDAPKDPPKDPPKDSLSDGAAASKSDTVPASPPPAGPSAS